MIKIDKWKSKEKPDVFNIVKELEKEGWNTYTFDSYPGSYYDKHSHEDDELRIMLEGSMKFGARQEEHVLKPGDKILVGKGTVHWAEVVGNKKAIMLSASKK